MAVEPDTDTESATALVALIELLSPRERQIAVMIAQGDEREVIAKACKISAKTVDSHRAHVLAKLEVANNVKLAHLALREKWIDLA